MKWFKRFLTVLAAGTVLLATYGAVNAAPAEAHLSDCPSGYVCIWVDNNFEPPNAVGTINSDVRNLGAFPNSRCASGTWNDCLSSFYNNTSRTVALFEHANYEGTVVIVPPRVYAPSLDPLNDQVSSIAFW